ncbi:caspase family protein [Neorhizobium sp. P12A]|uniref:caspase family protein n=1 Tax=Neorhizobium sp. P12A TaxID=2268027 RepID=UPI0011F08B11|nr:caspase family protein [Neorhizobium sp. P12A]KAA0694376.1 caspase family protein [Neorhizobium sp. P12A]
MAKKALLVGLNKYSKQEFNLSGCVNDSLSLRDLLTELFAFHGEDFTIIADADATRERITSELRSLVNGCSSGDTLVFGYSGHGTRIVTQDLNGHPDGKIDAIVPYEANYASLITSQQLFDLITASVTPSVSFTGIYDCCHSGAIIRDVEFDENEEMVIAVQNRFIPIPLPPALDTKEVLIGPYNVFSACADDETAADLRTVPTENRPRGAFSYVLHKLIRDNGPNVSVSALEAAALPSIKSISSHQQTPVFYATDMSNKVFG